MAQYACNGIQIEAERFGDPSKPTVLLIMGLGMQLLGWPEGFCRMIAERGFQVIRFDNRDIGLSTEFTHLGRPNLPWTLIRRALRLPVRSGYTLSDMASDSVSLLDALNIKEAHIVGASMGGMIAQLVALEHRDRALSLTSIMSTTGNPGLPPPTREARARLMTPPPAGAHPSDPEGLRQLIEHSEKLLKTIGSPAHFPSTDVARKALHERLTASLTRSYRPTSVARQLQAIMAAPDRTSRLNRLRLPTLVLHGAIDPLVRPECGEATAVAIPGARMQRVAGMGHDLPEALWPQVVDSLVGHFRSV